MASELFNRETMQSTNLASYVGALIEDEQRLVLVSLNPDDPWEGFRRLRRTMRSQRARGSVALFESGSAIEHTAEVIPLTSRRRAG